MTKTRLNMAVIGSGARGLWTLGHDFIRRTDQVRVLGFSDPREGLRKDVDWVISDMAAQGQPLDYSILTTQDHRELLALPDLDFVLVASPNHLHADYAEQVCEAGLGLLLEKPMATNVRDLNRIVAAEQRSGVKLFVGFCMRFNRLFTRAKELVAGGAIGRPRLVSYQDYFGLGRGYFRGRNRFARFSGGLLVEKACHSLDLIHWLLDADPVRVSCFGKLSVFSPRAEAAVTCADCKLRDSCVDFLPAREGRAEPLCVYNSEKDVDDTDAVLLEYSNGALAAYTECFYSPTVDRRFSIVGDEGELLASEERALLEYRRLRDTEWTREEIAYNPGGHRGADPNMVGAALSYFRGDGDVHTRVGSEAGRMSVASALAAQRSAKEHRVVPITEIIADESAGAFGDETSGRP